MACGLPPIPLSSGRLPSVLPTARCPLPRSRPRLSAPISDLSNLSYKLSVKYLSHILRPQARGTWIQEFGGHNPPLILYPCTPDASASLVRHGCPVSGHSFQDMNPPLHNVLTSQIALGKRAAVCPLPSARETPGGPVRGNPRRQRQSPHPCPSTLAFKTSAVTFCDIHSWSWSRGPRRERSPLLVGWVTTCTTLPSVQPFLMST